MNNENKYNGHTKEEILASPRLKGNRKGKYNTLLLFPNNLCPNNNFKTTTVVGMLDNDKFEVIGDCQFIRNLTNDIITIQSTSIDATLISTSSYKNFEVYGFAKNTIQSILDIFDEE